MWSKRRKSIFIRKVQRSSEHTLKVNLPKQYTKLKGVELEKGDLVSCNIMRLSDGQFVLIADKVILDDNPITLPEELEEVS